jgi:hypothetical protein
MMEWVGRLVVGYYGWKTRPPSTQALRRFSPAGEIVAVDKASQRRLAWVWQSVRARGWPRRMARGAAGSACSNDGYQPKLSQPGGELIVNLPGETSRMLARA